MGYRASLLSKTRFHSNRVGLGIIQAIHYEAIYVSAVCCAVGNLQSVYSSTWVTRKIRHLIVQKLSSTITRNHSTDNTCCCFISYTRLQKMAVPSTDDLGTVLKILVQGDAKVEDDIL